MSYCPKCGIENTSSANFCGRCGARLPAEAPVQTQRPKPKASAARPAAMAKGRKKRSWTKMAVPALILIAAVLVFKGQGQLRSCPDCDEILKMQKELQAVLAENEDGSLKYPDYALWKSKVSTLSGEIQRLHDHPCDMPIRKVKDKDYSYGQYAGSYTGEWKSTAPCGEGVFSGSYMDGATQYAIAYSGEWSGGAPNGAGAMVQRREFMGEGMPENWTSHFYEGTFSGGKLTGSGWSSEEHSSGTRTEYYNGSYVNGFLNGQANFLEYKDGVLYDMGVAQGTGGPDIATIQSERQETLNTLQTVAGVAVASLVTVGLIDMLDHAIGPVDPNSSAGKWLAEQHQAHVASMEQWQQDQEREMTEKELYDKWQALEKDAKWCATSSYEYERRHTESLYAEADEARKAYNSFRGVWG